VEGPKGELGFYVVSSGAPNPWRAAEKVGICHCEERSDEAIRGFQWRKTRLLRSLRSLAMTSILFFSTLVMKGSTPMIAGFGPWLHPLRIINFSGREYLLQEPVRAVEISDLGNPSRSCREIHTFRSL
jgi:hypothetical protein